MDRSTEWYDVEYPEEARATPVGRDVGIGETDHWVVERPDGELELLEPDEVAELQFEDDRITQEATLPIKELFDVQTDRVYDMEWTGPEEIPITITWDHTGFTVMSIEFQEGLAIENLEEILLVDLGGDD